MKTIRKMHSKVATPWTVIEKFSEFIFIKANSRDISDITSLLLFLVSALSLFYKINQDGRECLRRQPRPHLIS